MQDKPPQRYIVMNWKDNLGRQVTRLDRISTAALAALMVTSCGGDDSSPTPPPVATTTPTPTPTPTPTFSYTKIADLTGTQGFGTACFGSTRRANNVLAGEGSLIFNEAGLINREVLAGGAIRWTVTAFGSSYSVPFIDPADVTARSGGFIRFENLGGPDVGGTFDMILPTVAGMSAEYGLVGTARTFRSAAEPEIRTSCAWGVGTDPDDIPNQQTITYPELRLSGQVFDEDPAGGAPRLSGVVSGTGSLTGDTGTSRLTLSLSYVIEDFDTGAQTTIGPIDGELAIDVTNDRAGYFGLLNFGGAPEYEVNGAFFGPQGLETGFVISAQLDQNNDSLNERYIEILGYAIR